MEAWRVKPRRPMIDGYRSVIHRLLFALLAALLVGCSQQPSPPATPTVAVPTPLPAPTQAPVEQSGVPPGFLRHVDRVGGYTIIYPDDWARVPGEEGSVRLVANPLALAEPSPAASAMVIILPGRVADIESATGKTIRNSKDLLEYVLEGLRAEQNPSIGPVELFESNGLIFAAAQVSYYDTDYRLDMKTWVAVTVRGERALVAVTGSPKEEFDAYLPLFQRMVRTLAML